MSGPGGFDFRRWKMPEPYPFATSSHEMSRRAQRCEQMAGVVIPTRPWWDTNIECEWSVPPNEPIGSLLMSTAFSAILKPGSTGRIMGLNPGISSAIWTSLSFASTGATRRWPPSRPCWGSLPRKRHYPSGIWLC